MFILYCLYNGNTVCVGIILYIISRKNTIFSFCSCACFCKSAAASAHLALIAPHQFHFSIGAVELELSSWPSPAQASTRSSSRRLSANTQTQLSIITPVVLCRLTHLQESNQCKALISFIGQVLFETNMKQIYLAFVCVFFNLKII